MVKTWENTVASKTETTNIRKMICILFLEGFKNEKIKIDMGIIDTRCIFFNQHLLNPYMLD